MKMPEKVAQIKLEHLMKWAEENDQVDWLVEEVQKTKMKNGEEVPITYIEVRQHWVEQFAPEMRQKKKQKKQPTMRDKVLAMAKKKK